MNIVELVLGILIKQLCLCFFLYFHHYRTTLRRILYGILNKVCDNLLNADFVYVEALVFV